MGLFPGKEKMPIEDKLFNRLLEEFNFDRKYASKCIEDNRHNHITACYHLIDKRNKKIKDRQENYSLTKIDFKKKMKIGTNLEKAENDEANKTVVAGDKGQSPGSPNQIAIKPDLNLTAPIYSEPVKNGRKMMNNLGGVNNATKIRENSQNYQTIQHKDKQGGQAFQNDRALPFHRRAQTRGNGQTLPESKSPDKYTINNNLMVNLNDSMMKPVKRENSNTTNTTHVTGVTASTAVT